VDRTVSRLQWSNPTFPGYRSCWSRSSVPGGSAATKFDRSRLVESQNGKMPAPLGRNSLLCVHQGVPLPSSAVASDLISRSRWCRRRPKLGDQHQDFLEHRSRHRSSSGGEFHPSALTKPDVRLSPHPASTFQPTVGYQSVTDTRGSGLAARAVRANALRRFFDIATACTPVSPIGREPR
jgi:hypothetical protein